MKNGGLNQELLNERVLHVEVESEETMKKWKKKYRRIGMAALFLS